MSERALTMSGGLRRLAKGIRLLARLAGIAAGVVPIAIAGQYIYLQQVPLDYGFEYLPLGWVALRVAHFSALGAAEIYCAIRSGPARAGVMAALAVLISFQALFAALTLSVNEQWLIVAAPAAIIAALAALPDWQRAKARALLALIATLLVGFGVVALYWLVPLHR